MSTTTAEVIHPNVATMIDVPKLVSFDLYRDIHKAIRNELFSVTADAGRIDPVDPAERRQLARSIRALADLLGHHAEHEDSNLDDVISRLAPTQQMEIAMAHENLELRIQAIADLASSDDSDRATAHTIYLELAAFTATYLQHQDFEERVVMRLLDEHLDIDQLLALHMQIMASVTPEVMAHCIELILPAVNILERTEMLAGMQATAPAEAFAGVWALAGEVLPVRDYLSTAARLGLAVKPSRIA